jgi:low temperature requirement protein LtrA
MTNFFRINTVPHRHAESTSWLDLFFDLVYVAVLVELGNRLSHDISVAGVVQFLFLFIIVWWSWLEKVLFARFFPNDDIGQRMLTFIYMALIGLMAFYIHDMTDKLAVPFLVAYAATKVVLVVMYFKAGRQYPQYQGMTRIYIGIFSLAAIAWFAIAIFAPTNILLWALVAGIGILVAAILPLIHDRESFLSFEIPPTKKHYLRHRFGELTIIVLGEFFIKVITNSSEREIYPVTIMFFVLLLSISTSLWWLYFDHQEHSVLSKHRSRMEIWIYIHYPLLAAITAYGVIGNKIMALLPGEALSDPKRWLFCGALAVAVASTAVIEWTAREKSDAMSRSPQIYPRLLGAVLLLVLALLGGGLSVPLLVIITAGIVVVLVGLDISARLHNPVTEPA